MINKYLIDSYAFFHNKVLKVTDMFVLNEKLFLKVKMFHLMPKKCLPGEISLESSY